MGVFIMASKYSFTASRRASILAGAWPVKRARSGIVAEKFHDCLSWESRFGKDIMSLATRQSSLLSDLENTPRVNTSSADGLVFPAMILALDGLIRDEQTFMSISGSAFG